MDPHVDPGPGCLEALMLVVLLPFALLLGFAIVSSFQSVGDILRSIL